MRFFFASASNILAVCKLKWHVTCSQLNFFFFFFCTNIQNNPLQRHPTPIPVLPDFCFLTPVKDRHNSGHSHGLVYVNREQNVCLIKRSSSYVFVWLHQPCGGWTRIGWQYMVILWTKKFMNMRDEYQMIHSSLAVIVLEFPSWSDPPLPPSSHPNGACTQSPHPHRSTTSFSSFRAFEN